VICLPAIASSSVPGTARRRAVLPLLSGGTRHRA
jgi:hypothetical protein